jgi:hypothetical protein
MVLIVYQLKIFKKLFIFMIASMWFMFILLMICLIISAQHLESKIEKSVNGIGNLAENIEETIVNMTETITNMTAAVDGLAKCFSAIGYCG